MTARKFAQLEAAPEEELQLLPTNDIIDLTENETCMPNSGGMTEKHRQRSMASASPYSIPSASEAIGTKRPLMTGNILGPSDDGDVSVLMPTSGQNFKTFQQQFSDRVGPAQPYGFLPFDAFNRETMATVAAQHNTNDQDFLNSLIDQEGIQADAEMINQMTTNDRAEAAATEMGGPGLLFADDAAAKFEAELDRLSKML